MRNNPIPWILFAVCGIFALLLTLTINIIDPTERAVVVRAGNVIPEVHENGVLLSIPFIDRVRRFDLAPQRESITFDVGDQGAVSKDLQTIGVVTSVFWQYKSDAILTIVKDYNKDIINRILVEALKSSIKDEIGKYTIYDIIDAQSTISSNVEANLKARLAEHPITIVELNLTNWDWPDEFDKQIAQTMRVAQEVKQEQQNTLKQEQQNRREESVATKEKNLTVIKAEGELESAMKRAEAIRVEADAMAYKNKVLASNWAIEKQMKELEIERIKAERWNGAYVPNNNYLPIPFNYGSALGK